MRSDSGEVQHDGFEYNWMFRTRKWRAEVGPLSTGGWVRRRRWVRLMMKPARQNRRKHGDNLGYTDSSFNDLDPLVKPPNSGLSDNFLDAVDVWSSDDVELNWSKCQMIMKMLGRDGRKIELWKLWLRSIGETNRKGKARNEDGESDTQGNGSESLVQLRCPPKEYLIPVLRRYVCSPTTTIV